MKNIIYCVVCCSCSPPEPDNSDQDTVSHRSGPTGPIHVIQISPNMVTSSVAQPQHVVTQDKGTMTNFLDVVTLDSPDTDSFVFTDRSNFDNSSRGNLNVDS